MLDFNIKKVTNPNQFIAFAAQTIYPPYADCIPFVFKNYYPGSNVSM